MTLWSAASDSPPDNGSRSVPEPLALVDVAVLPRTAPLRSAPGIEGHIAVNWTGKIECLYLDFGSISATSNQPNVTLVHTFNSRIVDNVVCVGVNYKFDSTRMS